MKCPRCQGRLVKDQIFTTKGPNVRIDIWRCLNCGGTIETDADRIYKEKEEGIQKFQAV